VIKAFSTILDLFDVQEDSQSQTGLTVQHKIFSPLT